ncbi:MAG: rRNA pseudouridine synthase [Acholeplasmatales bacterium]|nr:rRNA pseudouridine synthase [Acholeplasmatales bacterium]
MERLDKILSHLNYGTRKEVKDLVKKGYVSVNGNIVKNSDIKVDPSKDEIKVLEEDVNYQEFVYIMLNKPSGVVSATEDPRYETVVDLMPEYSKMGIFPFGRLDIDTEGLVIMSNDGTLAHALLSPKKHVDKKYYVEYSGEFKDSYFKRIEKGIQIDDYISKPGKAEIICPGKAYITIHEGKFHEVKKMFEALNMHVDYLKRVEFKNIKLDEALAPGDYRPLTEEEIKGLKEVL